MIDASLLELRYLCYRLQQIQLLYLQLQLNEHTSNNNEKTNNNITSLTSTSSSLSIANVNAQIMLFLESVTKEIERLVLIDTDLLFRYETILCDVLIPASDELVTEELTRCK